MMMMRMLLFIMICAFYFSILTPTLSLRLLTQVKKSYSIRLFPFRGPEGKSGFGNLNGI